MKLKWNGFDLELTVEELKQMVDKGLIDPNDEKVPYPDTWKELMKQIPNQPLKPQQPYIDQFPIIATYGCPTPSILYGATATWDGTTALNDNEPKDEDGGKPRCLRY